MPFKNGYGGCLCVPGNRRRRCGRTGMARGYLWHVGTLNSSVEGRAPSTNPFCLCLCFRYFPRRQCQGDAARDEGGPNPGSLLSKCGHGGWSVLGRGVPERKSVQGVTIAVVKAVFQAHPPRKAGVRAVGRGERECAQPVDVVRQRPYTNAVALMAVSVGSQLGGIAVAVVAS
mmetsp:Transcript_8998/g.19077  ORF Transcript_8998/g.19077 Transcript_8998/m.19077 type:complete len:173 (-) Transcript_8998:578-1096(-)